MMALVHTHHSPAAALATAAHDAVVVAADARGVLVLADHAPEQLDYSHGFPR